MPYHLGARLRCARAGVVARAIVDHEDFFPRGLGEQTRNHVADRGFLVQRRNDNGD
jgi:hypothetical protein